MTSASGSLTQDFQPLTGEEFLRNLRDSGLCSPAEVQTILGALPGGVAPADGEALMQRLTAEGRLTAYQADAVRGRRFDEVLLDDYEVLDRLGAGGMGTVYKARHRRMKRVVAIKVLSQQVAQAEHFVQRFQREVEAAARLSHPNVVMAFDAGEARAGHFLVMEFVNGRDLASEVQKTGPLSPREAVDCVLQAARALEYAHSQGVIHRDIKPANLLRDDRGVVKVADLGLARISDPFGAATQETRGLTQAGTIMGTVDFMPPEQAMGSKAIDHRADIYSLGCTLFFLIAGRPPFVGETLMAILLQHREAPVPSLGESGWTIPDEFNAVFRRMAAKKPDDRFSSMTEVVRALEAVALPAETEPRRRTVGPAADVDLNAPTVGALSVTEPAPRSMSTSVPAPQTTGAAPLGLRPSFASWKVLLVEPSRTQSVIIRKFLQEFGITAATGAASGCQALQIARNEHPRAVLSAMHLPDMTGLQLAQHIASDPSLRSAGFVLITSKAESESAEQGRAPAGVILLPKPFDAAGLAGALDRAVRNVSGPSPTPSGGPDPAHLKVLIVDDSPAARSHIRNILSGLGFSRFTDAADGTAAIALLAAEKFDLIVTDYNMPAADGRRVVEFLRRESRQPSLPVLMVTTETDPGLLDAVRRLGVTAIFDKSFRAEAVRPVIEKILRQNT
jgi:serine/threonine protein kinase/DNA-binding response OmpR family regulator